MRRTKAERDQIETDANALYDQLNPDQMRMVRVSKHECIRRVTMARAASKK